MILLIVCLIKIVEMKPADGPSEADLRQKRSQARGKATKLLKELSDHTDEDDLALAIHHSEDHLSVMTEIQGQLDDLSVTDDSNHVQDLKDGIFKAKRVLARMEKRSNTAFQGAGPSHAKFSLDFHLPKFSGDITKWPEFWNLYKVSVDENPAYSYVEKFV